MKVMEGLQFGNECLNKMHQVRLAGGPRGQGGLSLRPRVHPANIHARVLA